MKLLGNSRYREIVQNTGTSDSSLRTGSNWLASVTGEKALNC